MALTCAARYGALMMAVWACASSTDEVGAPATAPGPIECPVTRSVQATAPRERGVDPLSGTWYVNEDRSIWAMAERDRWQLGGDKVPWIRPAGAPLVITGRRLDAIAPPLKAHVPCCYPTRFQATGLAFPTAGCWEVTAQAAGRELTFVTRVRP